ncbi:MAG: PKD domain-containing protein [Thermoplasmata archaeon]|nr:MAG: PKD domain-containing protein [Thermoplasmata archaeon]
MAGKKIVGIILFVLLMLNIFLFFQEEAEAASIDFIVLTDAPDGIELDNITLPVKGKVTAYASGYNFSSGYVDLVLVNWYEFAGLGTLDNSTGTSSTFTAGMSGGNTTILGEDFKGMNDTFDVEILSPTVDYIEITDTPDGTPLPDRSVPISFQEWGYCSAYNNTARYIGMRNATWSAEGGTSYLLGGSHATMNGIDVDITPGKVWFNASYDGHTDSVVYNVIPPTVDFILLTNMPNQNGTEIPHMSWEVGEPLFIYASGYNSSGKIGPIYVGPVVVNWTDTPDLGDFDNLTGTATIFTGTSVGVTYIEGNNITLGLGDFFMLNLSTHGNVDFIRLTDKPNGSALNTVTIPVGGKIKAYASGYNTTLGYVGLVEVNWSDSPDLGYFDNPTGKSATYTAGSNGGSTTITGQNSKLGVSDIFTVEILPPTLDSITLTDMPNGTELTTVVLYSGENVTAYASGYNATSGYLRLIDVNWSESEGLGTLDNLFGTSTTFTAGASSGVTTITGINYTLGMSDTFEVSINPPALDFINITDAPDGFSLTMVTLEVYGSVTAYASGYNYSAGYIGLIEVNWSESQGLGSLDNVYGTSTTFTAGKTDGLTTITGENNPLGVSDSFDVNILPPEVDYIILTDAPNGTTLSLVTLDVGESITVYASAYNNTCGYIGLIPVNWDEPAGLGNLDNSSGISTTFTAGHEGGSTTITGINSSEGVSDSFDIYINPPRADYILIRTQPGGGGFNLCDPANYKSYPVGGTDKYYGAMYNYTTDYFDDVPDNATWASSNELIVKVTSPGSSTDIDCDDQNWGTVTITLTASGKQGTTKVTVIEPTVDYILIRDGTGGLGNIVTTKTYVVWEVDHFYAAAYNDTADYLGEVEVVWESDDQNVGKVTSPGLWTNFTAQKVVSDSTCRVSADYFGIGDITGDLTVLAPRIDYITVVDSPSGGRAWVGDITYNEGNKDVFWAAGHNNTADYVKDVKATWESNNTIVGKVTSGPNEYTNFTAGWKGGYCRVTATFGTLTNQTGNLFVINVNTLPTSEAKYHNGTGFSGGNFTFSIDITLRVTGRKKNIITMGLEEDGVIVEDVEVTRHSSQPDIGEISYEMNVQKIYRVVLTYNGHNGGSNPIIVTFEFLGKIYSVHLLFNSQDGENQEAIIQFNDIIPLVGVVFFDASFSSDFEGYLVSYQWNFGDGTTGSGETLAHSYDENGEYTVTLTVTDDEGGSDPSTIAVLVENMDNNDQSNAIPSQKGAKGFLNESGECVVILQCPADLLITNPVGRQIGFFEGHPIQDIEGAFISMMYSDIEVYFIPLDERYTFEVRGTGSGFYDLSVIRVSDDIVRKYGVLDVTCSENTVDIYVFDFNEEEISISTNENDKLYSLEISTSIDDQQDNFILTDMKLKEDATHIYRIKNWEVLSSGKPVTLYIDEDNDGKIDKRIDLNSGLSGDEVDTLILKEPVSEPFPILLFIIACSVLALGVGGLLTEVGKVALLTLFLPLYTRLKKEELLDQPTRYKIYGYVLGNPGAYFFLMKEVLELGSGQLVYHLKQLEEAQFIYSRVDGAKKRFYPAHVPKLKGGLHHLSAIEQKIFGIIRNNSGIGQKKIASSTGVSRQVAGYHLSKLEEVGFVKKEVVGRETRYYALGRYSV